MKPPTWIVQLARSSSIAYSQVDREGRAALEQLRALQLITLESQGSRRRVIVRDPVTFADWVLAAYPVAQPSSMLGRRASNIARASRSKAGIATHDAQPMLLRWFSADPISLWSNLTQRCGIVGITTDHIETLEFPEHWTLLTVENWESFIGLDYAPQADAIVALYTSGNIADAVLRLLGALRPPPTQVIHFGDYDWTGVTIFRRIRAMLPLAILHVPDNIAELFRDFANHEILHGQTPLVPREDDIAEVRQVLSLIAAHNAGLEQEIVVPPVLVM